MRTATAIALGFAGWLSTASGAAAAEAFRLEILWSAPVVTDPSRQPAGITTAGLILNAQSVSPDERTVLLADQVTGGKRSQVLLTDIERNRPDAAVTLTLKGALPAGEGLFSRMFNGPIQVPYVSTLAAGMSGDVWVGGSVTNTMTSPRLPTAMLISRGFIQPEFRFGKWPMATVA